VYGWIWHHLPGPVPVRVLLSVVLLVAVVAALFVWVFPAVAPYAPFNDGTVNQ
jgi:hypothetical protein